MITQRVEFFMNSHVSFSHIMKYFVIFLVLIAVSYSINGVFAEEQSLTDDSTPTQWNEGKIKWYETSYPSGGTGVVQVIDPDMNLNPGKIDNFDVDVWSGSDFAGIDLTLTETDDSSGVFEGTVFFTTSDDSSGHRLRVEEGDTIFSKYDDITILKPNTTDELVLISTATIQGDSVSMIEDRITLDKESYAWDDIVFITITAPELNLDNKSIEKIDDPEKFPVEITTRHFEIDKYQLVETGVDTGIFSGKITLRGNEIPNVDYNDDDGISVFFEYEEDKVSIGSAPIVNDILSPKKQQQNGIPADEIKCKDGFVVAIKNTNGNPACVKPETKQKLMERGWAEPEPENEN